ncbi:efflux RND transporter periplasmic adaptor subunit [Achromobacter marplatensis]|uniref:Efflux RND transporter periplasmic adaptor subunit n=1 Tax=Achromobacter marplatensis TaxID=470868 RepID=A0AA43B352_9BURK|nr:efflux RND transporter periplasmic adaptor subunit [Achromobacter marplatensis]MDH2052337.1 efflux RND transporter periplasmic adaptor subunit [Achromobacter marplatensis]
MTRPRLPSRTGAKPTFLRAALLVAGLTTATACALFLLPGKKSLAVSTVELPTVSVALPMQRTIIEWDDYVGRFEASRRVEVRPRVSGQIVGVHFKDGEIVQQGQLLFSIDSRPYQAAYAEAQAGLASATSELALARVDLARAQRLVGDSAISKSDIDQLQARVRAGTANVAGAQARVALKSLELEFTEVRSPMTGRVSDRRVDPGNLVMSGEAGNGTRLTTINALDPIYFTFDASEALYLKAMRAQEPSAAQTQVEVRLQDEPDYTWRGKLDFTDNGIDPRSGTIRMRAVIENPKLFLTPGLFGNMRLASGSGAPALLIPDSAVQMDQTRKTVLTVSAEGTVLVRAIELGPLVDGLRIVRAGLAADDRVIVGGQQHVIPGAKVQTKPEPAASQSGMGNSNPLISSSKPASAS